MKNRKKRNKEEFMLEKFFAIFCISLMTSMTITSAYSLAPVDEESKDKLINEFGQNQNALTKLSLAEIFNLDILPSVKAEATGCCIKLNNEGGYCKSGALQSECNVAGAGPFYSGMYCDNIIGDDCKKGTCIQQNGDCDLGYSQKQCKDQTGHFVDTIQWIDECRPACCILKNSGETRNAQFTYYGGKCELIKADGGYDSVEVNFDKTYAECIKEIPLATMGYCSFQQISATQPKLCRYMTYANCIASNPAGEWLGDKACTECRANYEQKCSTGNEGDGVYNFDSCGARGTLVPGKKCGPYQVCETNQCIEKQCEVGVNYTSLNYNTTYLKAGEVEIKRLLSGNINIYKTTAGKGKVEPNPSIISLSPRGGAACFNYIGPGEESYMYICSVSGLTAVPIDMFREKICDGSLQIIPTIDNFPKFVPYQRSNVWQNCSNCGLNKTYIDSNLLSEVFSFLGADFLSMKWWDYWPGGGFCDVDQGCEGFGDCIHSDFNDCVPKYSPGNAENCTVCMSTEASSPWSKCGTAENCQSRGYCDYEQIPVSLNDVATGALICSAQTVAGIGMTAGTGELLRWLGLEDTRDTLSSNVDDKKNGLDTAIADFGTVWKGVGLDFSIITRVLQSLGPLIRMIITAPGVLIGQGYERTVLNSINNYFGWTRISNPKQTEEDIKKAETDGKTDAKTADTADAKTLKNLKDVETKGKSKNAINEQLTTAKTNRDELVNRINKDTTAGVTAAVDNNGKIILTDKITHKILTGTATDPYANYPASYKVHIKTAEEAYNNLYTANQNAFNDFNKFITDNKLDNKYKLPKTDVIKSVNLDIIDSDIKTVETKITNTEGPKISARLETLANSQKEANKLSGISSAYDIAAQKDIDAQNALNKLKDNSDFKKSGYTIKDENIYDKDGKIYTIKTDETWKADAIGYRTQYNNAWNKLSNEDKKKYITAASKATTPSVKQGLAVMYGENYGKFMYQDIGVYKDARTKDVWGRLDAWWGAQGQLLGFAINQLKGIGLGLATNIIWSLVNSVGGEKGFKVFGLDLQCILNVKCLMKVGFCYGVAGDPLDLPTGAGRIGIFPSAPPKNPFLVCMGNNLVLPVIFCTVESIIAAGMNANSCMPTNPWNMPGVPSGYNECHKCNDDPYRGCTASRCQSLSSDGGCIWTNGVCGENATMVQNCGVHKTTVPAIEVIGYTKNNNIYSRESVAFSSSSATVIIKTDIYSKCKWSFDKITWAEITAENFGRTHTLSVPLDQNLQEYHPNVQCDNACPESGAKTGVIEFKINRNTKPDTEGPIIVSKFPGPDYLFEGSPAKTQNVMISVTTDETGNCKYKRYPFAEGATGMATELGKISTTAGVVSRTSGLSPDQIPSQFSSSGIAVSYSDPNMILMTKSSSNSKQFNATVSVNNSETQAYIILCRDNAGQNSSVPAIIRFRASDLFSVDISEPTMTITEPQPQIIVKTGRRDATCYYSLENKLYYTNMTKFESTGLKDHKAQITSLLTYGMHKLWVTCYDVAGNNIASAWKEFNLLPDTTAPKIVRVYNRGGMLYIATDESTTCQYSTKSFDYGSGTDMSGNSPASKEHEAEWNTQFTYYVICKDRFGNEGSQMTVKPIELGTRI